MPLNPSEEPVSDVKMLYDALKHEVKEILTFEDFKTGFDSLSDEALAAFFQSIDHKTELTYLDLPLRSAITIHAILKGNPWKK